MSLFAVSLFAVSLFAVCPSSLCVPLRKLNFYIKPAPNQIIDTVVKLKITAQLIYSFYKCPDATMDLDRKHRNRANQQMFHDGAPGAGPSTRRRFA